MGIWDTQNMCFTAWKWTRFQIAGLDFSRFERLPPLRNIIWCKLMIQILTKIMRFFWSESLVHNVPRLYNFQFGIIIALTLVEHQQNLKHLETHQNEAWWIGILKHEDMICLSHSNPPFVDHFASGFPYGFSKHFLVCLLQDQLRST